ncbi:5192_t:CDS:2 [Entrophospora sp. SA101]|nr:5192_t:CDS:2 [Entrophospora sp. SA101]
MQKPHIFSGVWLKLDWNRDCNSCLRGEQEKQQNQEIVQRNIAEIVNNCVVNSGHSMEIERVLNDVCGCLERLDLASIDSNNPIASGIVDIAEGVDKVVDELSEETKHILKEVELSKLDFSEKTGAIYQWL